MAPRSFAEIERVSDRIVQVDRADAADGARRLHDCTSSAASSMPATGSSDRPPCGEYDGAGPPRRKRRGRIGSRPGRAIDHQCCRTGETRRHPARYRVYGRCDSAVSVSIAFAKWQVAIYPVGEVMFFRSFSSLVVCAAFILPFTGFSVLATRRPDAHIARGLSQINFLLRLVGVALGLVAQGTRRSDSLTGAVGGIHRRPHRHQSGRGFAPGPRTVRLAMP
jgi:hypothetical protein